MGDAADEESLDHAETARTCDDESGVRLLRDLDNLVCGPPRM